MCTIRRRTTPSTKWRSCGSKPKVAVITGNKEEAIRRIQQWDLLTRKLQVGIFIRTGHLDEEVRTTTEDLREELEKVRDAILAGDVAAAKKMIPTVQAAYKKCRDATRK